MDVKKVIDKLSKMDGHREVIIENEDYVMIAEIKDIYFDEDSSTVIVKVEE